MPDPAFLIGGICKGRRVPAVTIFGWDDVLCPTTHAKQQQDKAQGRRRDVRTSRLERKELLQLGQSVVRLVSAARRHGPVVIVTKSRERWVRGTADLLLPGGAALACLDSVEIVSSSDRFGADFPNQPACWQIAALSYVTNRYLLSSSALAQVRLADAAAAVGAAAAAAAGAQEVEGRTADDGGGRLQGAGVDLATGETGASRPGGEDSGSSRQSDGGGCRRRTVCRMGDLGTSSSGSSDGDSSDDETSGMRPRGILIAVATASRSWENKSAALTLREHHQDVVAKTVALVEAPTPSELKNQLDLLADNLEQMFGHGLLQEGTRGPSSAEAPPTTAPVEASPAPAMVETASTPPAAPSAPAPPPAPPAPVVPQVSPSITAPAPAAPESPVVLSAPTLELPLELWRLAEEDEDEKSPSPPVKPGSPLFSSIVVVGTDDDDDDDDNCDNDGDRNMYNDGGGTGRCGSFWGSASSSSCASSPASTTVSAPLDDATDDDVDLPSNDTAPGVLGPPAIVLASPKGGGTPQNYRKSGKQHLSLWSNDGSSSVGGNCDDSDDDEDEDDDDEYLTAACSESTMSSNVSSLIGEVGAAGGLPFAMDGPELLSPPLGWAGATAAPPNPPPRLHRRRSKPKAAVAVE